MHTQHTQRYFSRGLSTLAFVLGMVTTNTANAAVFKADFNRDGLEDMAVGVPNKDVNGQNNAGAVDVFYGHSGGMLSNPSQQFHQDTPDVLGGTEVEDRFGQTVAIGDFNGDTYDDLAIGVPREDITGLGANTGAVNVLYGTTEGLRATGNQLLSLGLVAVNNLQDAKTAQFGASLAAGDYNRDGYSDLAVGASEADILTGRQGVENAGGVAIFFGGPNGFIQTSSNDRSRVLWFTQNHAGIPGQLQANNRFGSTFLATDLNHDRCAELIVGSPFEDIGNKPNAGAVTVFSCVPGQTFPAAHSYIVDCADNACTSLEAGDLFGAALAVGDFNRDTHLDLAIGHEGENTVAGAVTVLYGSAAGIDLHSRHEVWTQDSPHVPGESEDDDFMGAALVAADFDNDGIDDLAIGIPGEGFESLPLEVDHSVGRVVVLYGATQGLTVKSGRVSEWHRNSAGVLFSPKEFDVFGIPLSIGDLNHDHIADLIVGVPGHDMTMIDGTVRQNAGMIQVLYGAPQGLSTLSELGRQTFSERTKATQSIPAEAGNNFGGVLP